MWVIWMALSAMAKTVVITGLLWALGTPCICRSAYSHSIRRTKPYRVVNSASGQKERNEVLYGRGRILPCGETRKVEVMCIVGATEELYFVDIVAVDFSVSEGKNKKQG